MTEHTKPSVWHQKSEFVPRLQTLLKRRESFSQFNVITHLMSPVTADPFPFQTLTLLKTAHDFFPNLVKVLPVLKQNRKKKLNIAAVTVSELCIARLSILANKTWCQGTFYWWYIFAVAHLLHISIISQRQGWNETQILQYRCSQCSWNFCPTSIPLNILHFCVAFAGGQLCITHEWLRFQSVLLGNRKMKISSYQETITKIIEH